MVVQLKFALWTTGLALLFLAVYNVSIIYTKVACVVKTCGPAQTLTIPNAGAPVLQPNELAIPSLGVLAPIQYVTNATEKTFQQALVHGVVHFPGTAQVGQVGNVYIFGHSSDYIWSKGKYKTIFAHLPGITTGVEIYVSDSQGVMYRYVVFDQFVTSGDNLTVLSQDTNNESLLTLQTSYPIGTAFKRYIVRARLTM